MAQKELTADKTVKHVIAERKRLNGIIANTAKFIAQNKGFANWHLFTAEFVSEYTVVVLFNNTGRLACLTLQEFEQLTKKDSVNKLLPYLTPDNKIMLTK